MDAPKSILETEKTLKTLSSGQIIKKTKNPKKPPPPKKNTGLVFFFKRGFFPTLDTGAEAGAAGGPGGSGEVGGRGAEDARGQYCQSDASQHATSGIGYHGTGLCRFNTAFSIVPVRVPYDRLVRAEDKIGAYRYSSHF